MKHRIIQLSILMACLLCGISWPAHAAAKPGYKITLQVDDCTDSMVLICYYYAQEMHVLDTAYNNGRGKFVFQGDRELKPGLYFFTNNGSRYTEFVVYNEKPEFQFRTKQSNWVSNMKVRGSRQNEIYYSYQCASDAIYKELDEVKRTLDSTQLAEFKRRQHLRIDSLKLEIMEKYPSSMFSKMMESVRNIDEEVPQNHPDGTPLTDQQRYEWFMQHYFDHMPLDEDFIIRTPKPVFYQRVMDYMDKYMRGMPPELICPLLDSLIDRSEPAPEVFRWLLFNITEKYLQSNIMVYDEVYVHLVQRYFATGKADWLAPSTVDEQIERANKWERLLVGRTSPELVLFDTLRHVHSLHRMPGRYTLLLFWSPTCGHCRDIIPEIYRVFNSVADSLDMTAYAILSDPDEVTVEKWKKFLADHHIDNPRWVNLNGGEANVDWREVYDIQTTPQIYLVENEKHTFVAKKLNAKIFKDICKQLK